MTLYAAAIKGLYHGQTIENVVHFKDKVSQGSPPPTTQLIAEDIVANWLPAERLLHNGQFRWNSVEVTEIRNPAPMSAHIAATTLAGNGGSSQSHSVSCFKIRKVTNRGGRKGFGKLYIGGIEASLFQGDMVISQTGIDRLLAFMAAIESRYLSFDAGPVPFQMVLVHKDANVAPDFVTTLTHYPVAGVQRRRNKFVGI